MPLRVAIVCPSIVNYDAISAAACDTYFALANEPDFEAVVLTSRADVEDLPVHIVGVPDLLLNPLFVAADLIIYHFGFHNEWFNTLIARKGRTPQIVRFHNVTPQRFAPRGSEASFGRSFQQIHSLKDSDEIWADSEVNAAVLREYGFDESRLRVIPLIVDSPGLASLRDKSTAPLEILFIGRFVASKGVLDLIEAVDFVRRETHLPFRLRLIGNLEWADHDYLRRVQDAIAAGGRGLKEHVDYLGTVDDATREELLHAAHILAIPSYHEGFCKPVIEALRSGAVPVGYAAYNIPAIASGFGRLVPTGNKQALAVALLEVMEGISSALARPSSAALPLDRGPTNLADFDNEVREYVSQFTFDRVAPVMRDRVRRLLGQKAELRDRAGGEVSAKAPKMNPRIIVLPDDVLREMKRESLNRICSIADWSGWTGLPGIMMQLNDWVGVHRKSWEFALCIAGLEQLGVVTENAVALSVGAGYERPLYYFANKISKMIATDLYDNELAEGKPDMLTNPEKYAPIPYRQDHLQVLRMPGDDLKFDDQSFDFVFSLSSIEHFGSRDIQRKSVSEMTRVTRPGGVICIATELLLNETKHVEYFTLEELEEIFIHARGLQLEGGELDLRIAKSLIDYPLDLAHTQNIHSSPHITLKQGENLWTSVMLFLRKTS